jgi:hypothetical protein
MNRVVEDGNGGDGKGSIVESLGNGKPVNW